MVVLSLDVPPPPEHLAMPGDIFGCHIWWGYYWHPEARDVAYHSTMHKTATVTKNYPVPKVNGVSLPNSNEYTETEVNISSTCFLDKSCY